MEWGQVQLNFKRHNYEIRAFVNNKCLIISSDSFIHLCNALSYVIPSFSHTAL
jgi:hypothetical protein